jgi:hypothetical protein
MTDYQRLVHKYEPVLGFSKDSRKRPEAFFPMPVEDYVARCGLWHQGCEILPPGRVTPQKLAALGDGSADYHLAYATRQVISRFPQQAVARAMARGITLSRLAALQDQMALSIRSPRATMGELQAAGLGGLPALATEADLPREAASHRLALAAGETPGTQQQDLNLLYGKGEDAALLRQQLSAATAAAHVEAQGEMVDLVLLPAPTRDLGLAEPDLLLLPDALGLSDSQLAARGLDVAAASDIRRFLRDVLAGATQLGPDILAQARDQYYGGATVGTPPAPPTYYYHVIPDHKGHLVLQYWFFYAYNDWGTAHDGINDHEGDWEGVMIFLRDEDTPEHVAYSRHFRLPPTPLPPFLLGPDTRQWQDQHLHKLYGYHPLVRVGCGSHAGYVDRKDHVLGLPGLFSVKDAARDNQLRIGPGQRFKWERRIDLAHQEWAHFRGRWGILERGLRGFGTASPQGPRSKSRWSEPVTWAWIPPY